MNRVQSLKRLPREKYWELYERMLERIPNLEFPRSQMRVSGMLSTMRKAY